MNRIRELRIAAGKSQAELADLIHVNKQTISQYERGVRYPKKENMEALADYFNVSIDYLTGKVNVTQIVLTPEERHLIESYRKLSASNQHLIDAMLDTMLQQNK